MSNLTIVMYHYVRDVETTPYPRIKALSVGAFEGQLEYLRRHYNPISGHDLMNAVEAKAALPPRAVLLTFDDAYKDHFTNVLPLLERQKLSGCFFPPAQCILENRVLDVNKIHFILASVPNPKRLVKEVRELMDVMRGEFELGSFDAYWGRCGIASRYDPAEVMFVKRMLQKELPEALRAQLTDDLFQEYVTGDEETFARELYMDVAQVSALRSRGMYVGSHGFSHRWLNAIPVREQKQEIDASLRFLKLVGANTKRWMMCYPYGGYDDSVLGVLRERDCCVGLTTRVGIADLAGDDPLTLPRLDTNDLPKVGDAAPNEWTGRAG